LTSRAIWGSGFLLKGFETQGATEVNHDTFVVDAGEAAAVGDILAADDAARNFVLTTDGVF